MKKYFSNKDPKRYDLLKRKSKVNIKDFGKPVRGKASFKKFLNSLPNILSARDMIELARAIRKNEGKKSATILMMGAHPVKCGLSPFIIDLLKSGYIDYVATNGATAIHDFEIAFCGKTSEDVGEMLPLGKFGMARQTGQFINRAINSPHTAGLGMGEAVGKMIAVKKLKFRDSSILYHAFKLNRPVTCHVAIGTDIIHQHPETDPGKLGRATYLDFLLFTQRLTRLQGGIIVNLGSAVIMPEVFLKAVNMVRNSGRKLDRFTAANMDMIPHYRPVQNVLSRPLGNRGKSMNIPGKHEIMFPLLYQAIRTP